MEAPNEERKVGRPTKFKPEYCELLIEHMAKGLSFEAFAGRIGVSRRVLFDWEKAHQDFLHAKEIGIEKARIFWEELGIKHILNESESVPNVGSSSRSLNASVWIFNMKNRFQWRDKQPGETDVVVNNYQNQSDEELKKRAAELAEEIIRENGSK